MRMFAMAAMGLLTVLPLAAPAEESSKISANAGGVELVDLIARFAKRTGKQVVVDPRVRAQAPLIGMDPAQITQDQLQAILDVHQFVMVQSGDVYVVAPDANARQLPTPIYTEAGFKGGDHELVTLLVQPKNLCAAFLVPVLRPLMPQQAHLAAETQTNTLILNDRAVNARRIAALVEQLDKRANGKKDCPAPGASMTPAPAAPPKPVGQ